MKGLLKSIVRSIIYILIITVTFYTLHNESASHDQESIDFSVDIYRKSVRSSDQYNAVNISVKYQPEACNEPMFLQIFVHSAPNHFRNRKILRGTWASITSVKNLSIRTTFVIGMTGDRLVDLRVDSEAQLHSDILLGDFRDTYWNLTVKHLFALRMLESKCRETEYFLKTDDDIFVDIFQVVHFLTENFRGQTNYLGCAVQSETEVKRSGRWKVHVAEYPFKLYPRYCAGAAYVASKDVVSKFLAASMLVPALKVDDVYVTGILRHFVGINPEKLNVYFTENETRLMKWSSESLSYPSPWMFGVMKSKNLVKYLESLWKKTLKVYFIS